MQGLPVSEYKDEMDKAPPSHKYRFRRAKKVILPDMKVCAFRQGVAGLEQDCFPTAVSRPEIVISYQRDMKVVRK